VISALFHLARIFMGVGPHSGGPEWHQWSAIKTSDYESGGRRFESFRARQPEVGQPSALLRHLAPYWVTWRRLPSNREVTPQPAVAGCAASENLIDQAGLARARDRRGQFDGGV